MNRHALPAVSIVPPLLNPPLRTPNDKCSGRCPRTPPVTLVAGQVARRATRISSAPYGPTLKPREVREETQLRSLKVVLLICMGAALLAARGGTCYLNGLKIRHP